MIYFGVGGEATVIEAKLRVFQIEGKGAFRNISLIDSAVGKAR